MQCALSWLHVMISVLTCRKSSFVAVLRRVWNKLLPTLITVENNCGIFIGSFIGSKSLYWKQSNPSLWCILNGLHAAGYNSAESEPILMKFGKLSAKCWGLAMADFGRDPHSSHSLRGVGRKNVFCQVNNACFHWFPVWQFSRILHTTTLIGVAM